MIGVRDIDQTWEQYGLEQAKLDWMGEKIPYKAIVKNDNCVAIVSDKYKVLPNEEAVKLADEVATEVGAVPFHEFGGDWFTRVDKHVFGDEEGRKVHALYAFDEPVNIGGNDTIQLGFGVHNSIDGSMGFSCGAFTFRNACANMVFMGSVMRGRAYEMRFDERHTISYVYHRHSKDLVAAKQEIAASMKDVIERGYEILDMYRKWKEVKLNSVIADALEEKIPQKYVPEYLQAKTRVAQLPSVWSAYNDITQAIWHNNDTGYDTKKSLFDTTHTVLVRTVA